ncbi:MAG: hypothetical protein K0R34_2167 [Herbinix sp.]|jgi:hypothetical protein|nr:hypothetical protein [Herbinix sp.]
MAKGINLQITELKEKLADVINEAKLPPTIVQMALFEINSQVNNLAAQAIESERKALEEGGKEDGKEIHKDNTVL